MQIVQFWMPGVAMPHLPLAVGHFGSAVPMRAVSSGASTKRPFWKVCCQDESAPRNAARSWRRLSGVEMSSARGLGIGAWQRWSPRTG